MDAGVNELNDAGRFSKDAFVKFVSEKFGSVVEELLVVGVDHVGRRRLHCSLV